MRISIAFIATFLVSVCCAQKKNIEVADIWTNPNFFPKMAGGFSSMKDGIRYTNTDGNDTENFILIYNFADGKVKDTLLRTSQVLLDGKPIVFTDYKLSDDETKVLLTTSQEQLYRHSFKAAYYVYDLKSKKLTPVSGNGKQLYATLSPDGSKVAFVRDNNLYINDLVNGQETAITADGKRNEIINGATDWVYEEEFSMDVAFSWNRNGSSIAFYKFDESRVKEFNLTYYGSLYPREEKYKYPKAGEENAKVDIYVYHLSSGKTIKMNTGSEREYIPRIKWTTNPDQLSVQRSNRHQNFLELMLFNVNDGTGKVIIKEENNTYIEITDDLTFLENGKQFIWSSSRSGHNHIYLYNMDGTLVKPITSGNYEITTYYGFDERTKTFYYQSAQPTPTERRISKITLDGKQAILSPEVGTNKAEFSTTFKYFVNTYSAYGKPYRCTLYDDKGKALRVLEDNKNVEEELVKYSLASLETVSVKNEEGILLNGYLIKPPGFDPKRKYPVLMHVYGGPGKQTVTNSWLGPDYLWHQMLAGKGYIIVSFDNRGTPGRGIDFANCIHKNMGNLEVKDQLAMARYMQSLSYVDSSRIGVWGWSYGGYMTSLLLTKGNGLYKCGIAVAPVINWRYYDSIYTERYLQTPQENPRGYDDNSPINFAKDLKGKFLLVHGATDDNVHMQNTMEFVDALVKEKKQFDLFIYPNKNHSIGGRSTRIHLYQKMTDFVLTNL